MNGRKADGLALARGLAERAVTERPAAEILICPPATLLCLAAEAIAGTPINLGGQDCHPHPRGLHRRYFRRNAEDMGGDT